MTWRTSEVAARRSERAFVQFARKPSEHRLLALEGRIGMWYGLRHIAALRLRRLATPPFDLFAACSGAPLHRVPRGLTGVLAGQWITPEVA